MKNYVNTLGLALVLMLTQSSFGQKTDPNPEMHTFPSKTWYTILTENKQVVHEGEAHQIDVSDIDPGNYLLVYEQKDGKLARKQLVLK
jgi:hypothetical protein